ncbi:RDD family protein [Clostridium lacusfryxellense]|uniref:RDD family protein n=1 Tax=Clostridium lacusfryxellense TaxID=205328 RepID=UPI001C0AFF10|nr:RDD family protein [Clostridium lacusfryxellense]MBU3112610.1 RDD family protein [Clostridium lacusfryxellense]
MLEQKDEIGNERIIDKLNNGSEELVGQGGNRAIKPTFFDAFKASIIDLVVVGAISTVGVFAADALLKIAGFAISEKFTMAFIIFMVVMVFYMSIMESGKKSATIGKKVARLIITKR